jgi:dienelactone hydrolase
MDHSEVVDPALGRSNTEAAGGQKERIDAIVDARVPDVRFLLDYLLAGRAGVHLDAASVGLVGHSFGGWTVLATLEEDPRVGAVVALAPGGSRHPLPGILPLTLTFSRRRSVPALYLAAENDVPIPPTAVIDVFERTPGPKRLFILQRADHQHFADYVESEHEALRAMSLPGDAAWIPRTMRPMEELCSGEQAHLAVRGLTLAHLDATLHGSAAAEAFLSGDVEARLASQGVETLTRRSLDR